MFTAGSPPSHRTLTLAALLLNPALILIDHGHFQYNCISLGLAAGAAAALASGRQLLGSFLFSLSLNHKQMGLFMAPAFFAHLLGWSLQHQGAANKVLLGEGREGGGLSAPECSLHMYRFFSKECQEHVAGHLKFTALFDW